MYDYRDQCKLKTGSNHRDKEKFWVLRDGIIQKSPIQCWENRKHLKNTSRTHKDAIKKRDILWLLLTNMYIYRRNWK